jgi:kynurenine formamidase
MPMPAEFFEVAKRVNNWGRWGPTDEIGTLNLLTPEAVRNGAACVRTGKTFSLALELSLDGVQTGAIPGRINPVRTMLGINVTMNGDPSYFCASDDIVTMGLQAGTHWDALAHVSYDNRLYNGFPADSITADGAKHCGIDKVKSVVGRGVLLDVARAREVERLEGGHAINPDDLQAAADFGKVQMQPGDIVLVRTGQMQHYKVSGDRMAYMVPSSGFGMMAPVWFRENDVAAVAIDNLTFDVLPNERDDILFPAHLLHLVEMGMTQGQNWDLEELAADCADDGQYTFMLDATPQPFRGGVGGVINPVAVK